MEQALAWDLFFWIMGIFGAIGLILLGIIAYFIKLDRSTVRESLNKHEDWITKLQEQVAENQEQTKLAILELQKNQQLDRERFAIFNEKLAYDIALKIRAMTPGA